MKGRQSGFIADFSFVNSRRQKPSNSMVKRAKKNLVRKEEKKGEEIRWKQNTQEKNEYGRKAETQPGFVPTPSRCLKGMKACIDLAVQVGDTSHKQNTRWRNKRNVRNENKRKRGGHRLEFLASMLPCGWKASNVIVGHAKTERHLDLGCMMRQRTPPVRAQAHLEPTKEPEKRRRPEKEKKAMRVCFFVRGEWGRWFGFLA